MPADIDAEIQALQVVIEALEPLDDDARSRVVEYTLRRLGLRDLSPPSGALSTKWHDETAASETPASPGVTDVRSLREEKQPQTAIEMAALVAYYLSEAAPPYEQRETVGAADVERYFKQANYRLPARLDNTLPNAAKAGYFDRIGRGEFRLNPVGYNLVTQTLPRAGGEASPTRRRTTRKATPKSAKK